MSLDGEIAYGFLIIAVLSVVVACALEIFDSLAKRRREKLAAQHQREAILRRVRQVRR